MIIAHSWPMTARGHATAGDLAGLHRLMHDPDADKDAIADAIADLLGLGGPRPGGREC
jgi:hypothetical protein